MTALAAPPRAPTRPAASPEGMGVPTAPPAAAAAVPPRRRRFEPVTMAQREAVWEAWRSGRSQRKVGREVGLDHSTVSKIWREQEAWDRRPRRVSIAELCEVAKEHTDERLRVHLTISLLGRQWSPTDIIPPACSILNPHAVTHGVSSNLLRALTDEMAKR